MAPFGYSAWLFLKNNPVVLYIAGAFAFLATFLSWQRLRDMRIRREAKEKAHKQVIEQIEEQTDEAIERVETERQRNADLSPDQLRDQAAASPHNRGRLRRAETD